MFVKYKTQRIFVKYKMYIYATYPVFIMYILHVRVLYIENTQHYTKYSNIPIYVILITKRKHYAPYKICLCLQVSLEKKTKRRLSQ